MHARGRGEISALIAGLLYPLAFAPFGYYPVGIAALVYMVSMTAWGYTSWTPVGVVLATGVLTGILAWATRPAETEQ